MLIIIDIINRRIYYVRRNEDELIEWQLNNCARYSIVKYVYLDVLYYYYD